MATPRKTVPLAAPHDPATPSKRNSFVEPQVTRRAFFAAVVVEGSERDVIPQDVQELVVSLGTRVAEDATNTQLDRSQTTPLITPVDQRDLIRTPTTRKRAHTDASALADTIRELVLTEQSYVKKLRILKYDYADPLRNFARKKEEALIPLYEANTLFANIDQILQVNEAFLNDLERMLAPNGERMVGGVGDVALKHFRDKRAFDCYKLYYSKREEAQAIFEREMAKKSSSGFPAYVERIKYSSQDTKNRVGLRELLIEPVQRIPRYTLLWQLILKHMPPSHPQRVKLLEAEAIAKRIAMAETDDQTKRATIMYCLERTVEGFPPGLISNSRRFIDCIDVEDVPPETTPSLATPSASSVSPVPLCCTLFLFDDRLVIVKRPNPLVSGRTLAGLDDIDRLIRTNGIINLRKSGMACKGVLDISEVVGTDSSGALMHFFLERPPMEHGERWSTPLKSYHVVVPPQAVNVDFAAREAKTEFLEKLWNAQAMLRTKGGRSVALQSDELEVDSRGNRTTWATTFFNVYQRTPYLGEPRKPKVVVHIDGTEKQADRLPFGINGPPFIIIRLRPMAGQMCRYVVSCNDPEDEGEDDYVQSQRVPERIVHTIHQFGLFQFRVGPNSRPTTPTAIARSRVANFGLDALSGLFSPSKSGRDVFGEIGASLAHKRTRSAGPPVSSMSRSSTDMTVSTNRFSQRSASTAATSMSVMDDVESIGSGSGGSGRSRKGMARILSEMPKRKLVKTSTRAWSPGAAVLSDPEVDRATRSKSPNSIEEEEEEFGSIVDHRSSWRQMDNSDRDLALRLELARQNSLTQETKRQLDSALSVEASVEETIYEGEDEPPETEAEAAEGGGGDLDEGPTITRDPASLGSITPTKASPSKPLPSLPSPGGSSRRRISLAPPRAYDSIEVETVLLETSLTMDEHFPTVSARTPSKAGSISSVEPLSIRKKSAGRGSSASAFSRPPSIKRQGAAHPLSPSLNRSTGSRRRASTSARDRAGHGNQKEVHRFVVMAEATKEDITGGRRAVKKIKKEVEFIRGDMAKNLVNKTTPVNTPSKSVGVSQIPRSPHARNLASAVSDSESSRVTEMRQLIESRMTSGGSSGISQRRSTIFAPSQAPSPPGLVLDFGKLEESAKLIEELADEAERQMTRSFQNTETLSSELWTLVDHGAGPSDARTHELKQLRSDLEASKRQTEALKQLLSDTTAENEILYNAFNEELDKMYEDIQLPEDQAWAAMTNDLRKAKETRNLFAKENQQLKRKLQALEQENEEMVAHLKEHSHDIPALNPR